MLVDTASLEEVVRRVRAGEGEAFDGLERDAEHRLELRLTRGSGRAAVRIDGEPVVTRLCTVPAESGPARLELRAIEPVELRSVTLQADRR